MIIKGLLRRYERWNPVHPTVGTFWGMGFGVGCGVGWGPGFGPEVIGYVGAGCGVGFSVGITLVGIGIGLPSNHLVQIPYSGSGALGPARSYTLDAMKAVAEDSWNLIAPRVFVSSKEAYGRLSSLKTSIPSPLQFRLAEFNKSLSNHFWSNSQYLDLFREWFRNRGGIA